jgi:hypothetical protein
MTRALELAGEHHARALAFFEELDDVVPPVIAFAGSDHPLCERVVEYRVGFAVRLMLFRSFHGVERIVQLSQMCASPGSRPGKNAWLPAYSAVATRTACYSALSECPRHEDITSC